MTVRIYVTCNVSIVVNISNELKPNLERAYFFDIERSGLSPCDAFVVYKKSEIIINYSDKKILCNEQEFDFIFATTIEDITVIKSNNCIFHGSAVVYDNIYAIAFMGASGSGKTTIVNNLEAYSSNFKRISDDLLLIHGNHIYRNYLPTKVRIKNGSDSLTTKTIKPSIKTGHKAIEEIVNLSAVISVDYSSTNINSFNRLDTFECIETLLFNSRSAPNNLELMQSITTIAKRIPIYSLNYHDNQYAVKCLLDVLNQNLL